MRMIPLMNDHDDDDDKDKDDDDGDDDGNDDNCIQMFLISIFFCYFSQRCGEVFCSKCSQFRRRLSLVATPDPSGISYRVSVFQLNFYSELLTASNNVFTSNFSRTEKRNTEKKPSK